MRGLTRPATPSPAILRVQVQAGREMAPQPADWVAFKRRYLGQDGRVVDTGNAGISHSEGQSYGMLFAVFFDDREAFGQMWTWLSRTLRRPNDSLFAWKYVPRGNPVVPDSNNATDGDLLVAWALLAGGAGHPAAAQPDPARADPAQAAQMEVVVQAPPSLGIPASGNARHEGLAGLTIRRQREDLLALMGPLRENCADVSGAYFAGLDVAGMAHWDVRCSNRSAWRISVPRDPAVAPTVIPCSVQTELCFLPAPRVPGDLGMLRTARCSAACELTLGAERRACMARCLAGTETVAAMGEAGKDRHIVIYVADLGLMNEGFLAGASTSAAALAASRRACEAVARGRSCQLAVSTINHCAAVVQAPDGQVLAGYGIELDDAEREARRVCGAGENCQVIVSGC